MIEVLASEAVGLTSLFKAVLGVVLLLVWARWATVVDKDAMFYNQNRLMWNTVQLAAAAIAFMAIFMLPLFPVGYPLGFVVIVVAASAYVVTRNREVPEEKKWRFNKDLLIEMMEERRMEKEMGKAVLRFNDPPIGLNPVPLPEEVNREPHLMFEQVIENAFRRNAQRLILGGNDREFEAKLIIDGTEYSQGTLPAVSTMGMIDYVKAQAGLDVANRRKKQIGDCDVHHEELGPHQLRVHTAGSTRGLTCEIEIDPVEQRTIKFDKLGFLENQAAKLRPLLEEPGGIVLVASPPGQGRTTTLYSLTEFHDPYTMDVHSLEARIERYLEGVKQQEAKADEVAKKVHSLMLKDPQVVMLSHFTNSDVAEMAAQNAEDGPRVYVGIEAHDMFDAMRQWCDLTGGASVAAKSLRAVVSQRLMRKLCPTCRQEYSPDAALLKKINLSAQRIEKLYKSGGQLLVRGKAEPCPDCGGLGYRGRIAAFEIMPIDDEARQLIADGQEDQLRTHLRRQKVFWLQEAALTKVVAGLTSLSELTRAMSKEQG